MSVEEKKAKIKSNYETIEELKRLLDKKRHEETVGITRAAYIKMIFDMNKKVQRQNLDLHQIVSETQSLQRDISSLSGRLNRTFTMAENNILKVGFSFISIQTLS